ncbi:SDR family oxidoreductase [Sutterella sp.]|uniref:SDR family oxidoreductase n=1 Tax=Sutterella sp. TaxID=1981025 RepID=UPI003FD8770B
MTDVLILGGGGRLGRVLAAMLREAGAGRVEAPGRGEVDAADPAALAAAGARFEAGRPDWVVCAAAWSDVAGAERNLRAARRGNVEAPACAARAAARWGAAFLHYSTDYVFSGGGRRVLHSGDRAEPQGAYGRTKREGERAVMREARRAGSRALVVRAGWLFSEATGEGFPARVLEQALAGRGIRMRTNQYGRPTSYEALARWSAAMILGDGAQRLLPGAPQVLHFAPEGPFTSRFALARRVLARAAQTAPAGARAGLLEALRTMTGMRIHAPSQPENCRLACEQVAFSAASACSSWEKSVDNSVDNFLRRRFAIGGSQD